MPLKDPIKRKEYQDQYRANNKDQQREYDAKRKKYVDDIFEISEDFYEFAIINKLENITKKMYMLFERM